MMIDTDYIVPHLGTTSLEVQETSVAALESLDPEVKARREQQIFEYIKVTGGATCWEVENALGLLHQTASSTITRLRTAGYLVDTGERRPTNTGRMATVWGVAQ
jgi:predicted ArsR family transcriptional regulator